MRATLHYFKYMTPEVQAIVYSLLAEYFSKEKSPLTRFDVAHLIGLPDQVSYPGAVILGWDEQNRPIGMVFVEVMPPRETRPYGHEISRLYVTPDARKKGYGGRLMMEAIAYISDTLPATHAFLVVGDENAKALSMYQSLGFQTHAGAQEAGSQGVQYLELYLPPRDTLTSQRVHILSPLSRRLAARLQMRRDKAEGRVSSARLFRMAT